MCMQHSAGRPYIIATHLLLDNTFGRFNPILQRLVKALTLVYYDPTEASFIQRLVKALAPRLEVLKLEDCSSRLWLNAPELRVLDIVTSAFSPDCILDCPKLECLTVELVGSARARSLYHQKETAPPLLPKLKKAMVIWNSFGRAEDFLLAIRAVYALSPRFPSQMKSFSFRCKQDPTLGPDFPIAELRGLLVRAGSQVRRGHFEIGDGALWLQMDFPLFGLGEMRQGPWKITIVDFQASLLDASHLPRTLQNLSLKRLYIPSYSSETWSSICQGIVTGLPQLETLHIALCLKDRQWTMNEVSCVKEGGQETMQTCSQWGIKGLLTVSVNGHADAVGDFVQGPS